MGDCELREISSSDELVHHGIKGMKWGVRKDKPRGKPKKQRTKEEKKALRRRIAIGAGVAVGVGLAAYGVYKYKNLKNLNAIELGKNAVAVQKPKKLGRTASEIDRAMVSSINAENSGSEGSMNCFHTSTAYIMNSLFGRTSKAAPFSGVDEVSGMVRKGRDPKLFDAIFSGIRTRDCPASETFAESIEHIPSGSTGILSIFQGGREVGHFINYEKTRDGQLTLIDCQEKVNNVLKVTPDIASNFDLNNIGIVQIRDFSNASLKDGADEILKNILR